MDAVEEKVGMMRIEICRPVGNRRAHSSDIDPPQRIEALVKSISRRTEHRHARLPCETKNLDDIAQRSGDGLVDKHRLPRGENRPCLFEMRPPIEALDEHRIDRLAQFLDRRHEPHAEFPHHRLRITFDPLRARRHVGAEGLHRGDDATTRHVSGRIRFVEQLCKGDAVRSVEADDADSQISRNAVFMRIAEPLSKLPANGQIGRHAVFRHAGRERETANYAMVLE